VGQGEAEYVIRLLDKLLLLMIKINPRYKGRDIFVFAGIELAIRYFAIGGFWEIKEEDCSRCGECCSTMTGRSFPFATESGCKYLEKSGNEHLCGLSYYRPNGCAVAELDLPNCTVVWRKAK
jgi:hypothetical protein